MNDGMDAYLERCLKNWSARHQPPRDGLERLMEMVSSPPEQRQNPILNLLDWLKSWYTNSTQELTYYQNEWLVGYRMQSRLWSSHNMTVNWRPAH